MRYCEIRQQLSTERAERVGEREKERERKRERERDREREREKKSSAPERRPCSAFTEPLHGPAMGVNDAMYLSRHACARQVSRTK